MKVVCSHLKESRKSESSFLASSLALLHSERLTGWMPGDKEQLTYLRRTFVAEVESALG